MDENFKDSESNDASCKKQDANGFDRKYTVEKIREMLHDANKQRVDFPQRKRDQERLEQMGTEWLKLAKQSNPWPTAKGKKKGKSPDKKPR